MKGVLIVRELILRGGGLRFCMILLLLLSASRFWLKDVLVVWLLVYLTWSQFLS